ncbi:MAG: TonB-dependent receptor [Bacteroidetes bacterium]|nr:MAG: TonB-dependent receptor [Bacteroidota bacterium]
MKNFTAFIALMFVSVSFLSAQSSLEGKVIEAATGEPIIFGNVALYKNGVLITGTETDFDGNYSMSNIDPGTYDVEATYIGFQPLRQTGVIVLAGKAIKLDFELSTGVLLDVVTIIEYTVPLIDQDNTTTGGIVTSEKIQNLPIRNINALAATTAGLSSIDGGDISIRGSRANATDYYIDGVRVSGALIPESEIDQLQVITGGIEAQYGDVTGGIISITTKGPSNSFSGSFEIETSQFLDDYGYNLINGAISGPLVRNKQGRSVLGFRLSGRYLNQKDTGPGALGRYRATESSIAALEADPTVNFGGSILNSAEFIDPAEVKLEEARKNTNRAQYDITAKIDARLSDAIDVTFSGNYSNTNSTFARGEGWSLLNWQYNPLASSSNIRGNFRFRHRLGVRSYDPNRTNTDAQKASLIRNASYTLQFGYQKNQNDNESARHGQNFYDYGHVGTFMNVWTPAVGESTYSGAVQIGNTFVAHAGYAQNFLGWTPSQYNPTLANYNNLQEDVPAMNQFNAFNSFWSDNFSSTWSGLHTNVGAIYNQYGKSEGERYSFQANAAFDIFPGGSGKGRHNIQFGILYEQRVSRNYNINPRRLWEIARLQANQHIIGIDTNNIIGTFWEEFNLPGVPDSIEFDQFQTLLSINSDNLFYKSVRDLTGQSLNEYVNVDELDPRDLTLDMFAPQELIDQSIVNGLYGYDYLGNEIATNTTFNDFFTDFDDNGRRKFTVAPWKPIYTAAFIQDKFTFKDIIFRLGLRVDRYDANTKVMKDPLSLYPIMGANDFFDGLGSHEDRPPNVEDDWKIYVESEGSTKVKAYRDGEQWYNAEGSPVNDGSLIFGGEIVNPFYQERDSDLRDIQNREYDPNKSFEDYTPQVNWMPRLAFSFPISNDANFFAHYDILVQRPPTSNIATAMDYYYFETKGPPTSNPNLKPEKTINYELGFKQRLSSSSAITLSTYYRELRDMVQTITNLYVPAPVNQYESRGNIDFGTVKGFSVAYDLRRTNNIEFTASYSLQFADGTGSNATSQRGLTERGNIRSLFPLSFDERHTIVANIDYRYGSGSRYNGPRWFGADVFSNTGVNLQVRGVSGRPYTATQEPTQFGGTGFVGSINGARLPWNVTLDMRINKRFRLNSGAEPEAKAIYMNLYFRVQNLLDTRNVIGVYSASGSPEDDGYLASPNGLSAINTLDESGRDSDAFVTSYQWLMLNNGFYTLPRRMFVGATLQF